MTLTLTSSIPWWGLRMLCKRPCVWAPGMGSSMYSQPYTEFSTGVEMCVADRSVSTKAVSIALAQERLHQELTDSQRYTMVLRIRSKSKHFSLEIERARFLCSVTPLKASKGCLCRCSCLRQTLDTTSTEPCCLLNPSCCSFLPQSFSHTYSCYHCCCSCWDSTCTI